MSMSTRRAQNEWAKFTEDVSGDAAVRTVLSGTETEIADLQAGTEPAAPAAGYIRLYADTNGELNKKDDAGAVEKIIDGGDAATAAEIDTGTETGKFITPAGLADSKVIRSDNWGEPAGGLKLDNVDDKVTVTFTEKVQAFECYIKPATSSEPLVYFGTDMLISLVSGVPTFGSGFANTSYTVNNVPSGTVVVNQWNHIVCQFDEITPTTLIIGNDNSTAWFAGKMDLVRLYNRELTAAEVSQLWNNGRPDLAVLPYDMIGASQTEIITNGDDFSAGWTITNGTLNDSGNGKAIFTGNSSNNFLVNTNLDFQGIGKTSKYFLVRFYVSANSLTVVGQANVTLTIGGSGNYFNSKNIVFNNTELTVGEHQVIMESKSDLSTGKQFGCYLSANATGGTLEIDYIKVNQIGNVLDFRPENFGTIGVLDSSGNGLHGVVSGAIALSPVQGAARIRDWKQFAATAYASNVVPAGYLLTKMVISSTGSVTLDIGSTLAGTDLLSGGSIVSGLNTIVVNKAFSLTAAQTIYFTSAAWGGETLDVYFEMEKI